MTLENKWNFNQDLEWSVDINKEKIFNKVLWHSWNNFEVTDNKFKLSNDLVMWFNAEIIASESYLESPIIATKWLVISYMLWWKSIKYVLSDSTIVWVKETGNIVAFSNPENKPETSLWLKVVWILEWEWKSDEVWQIRNFSYLSKWNIRAKIRKNAYTLIKNRKSWTIVNWVKYVNWDFEINWDLDYETLIIKDWNIKITWDLNIIGNKLWIIVLKDNYEVKKWPDHQKWNIFINWSNSVKYINAIIYADGGIFSTNWDDLSYQLVIKWSLFTRNTIWGWVWICTLPWGKLDETCELAKKYDLNYIRTWNVWAFDNFDINEWNTDNFVIIYNPFIQNNPPKGFIE